VPVVARLAPSLCLIPGASVRRQVFATPAGVRVSATDRNAPSDLLGAVKVTGSQGSWRYGTLLAAEDDMLVRGTAADGSRVRLNSTGRDFAIGRLLYEDTAGGGRRSIGWDGYATGSC
jgi:hypothetical protein